MKLGKVPRKISVDLRGLAAYERQEGAIVEMGRGTYRVVKVENGKATLELATIRAGPGAHVVKE